VGRRRRRPFKSRRNTQRPARGRRRRRRRRGLRQKPWTRPYYIQFPLSFPLFCPWERTIEQKIRRLGTIILHFHILSFRSRDPISLSNVHTPSLASSDYFAIFCSSFIATRTATRPRKFSNFGKTNTPFDRTCCTKRLELEETLISKISLM